MQKILYGACVFSLLLILRGAFFSALSPKAFQAYVFAAVALICFAVAWLHPKDD